MGKHAAGYARWALAVERGGLGHTAAARSLLEGAADAATTSGDSALLSLTRSTTGSLWRQAGRHAVAYRWDGRALAAAGRLGPDSAADERAATLDALVGLAADNLGLLRLGASARLLDRARTELATATGTRDEADEDWDGGRRPRLRIAWVSAELAMYSGDPSAALAHAAEGDRLAAAAPERHRVKTRLIAAAAAATAGEPGRAKSLATEVTERARDRGLVPLEWASWALRAGLDPHDTRIANELARTREVLTGRGVPFARG